jgi:putative hydrolase of the HAD superfamily
MPITTLFLDLDGTVYPNENGIWEAISNRMEIYMYEMLNIPKDDIPTIRQNFYHKYGTTLKGLQENYSIDQYEYLHFVHDIPIDQYLKPDDTLRDLLKSIPITKWIFTNSDHAHSERVLNALEIRDLFDGIIDVTIMNFVNKPDPLAYNYAVKIAGNPEPINCVFFEDNLKNLLPAKELGMKTVLVGKNINSFGADFSISTIYEIKNIIDKLDELGINE